MKEYKHCLDMIRIYLEDKNLVLNEERLDEIIAEELEKPANELDPYLIDLCLNALVAYRNVISKTEDN